MKTDYSALIELGLGEYEAKAYVALLREGPLTGYQLAKVSGIPRPNIYPILARLQERGAVVKSERDGTADYRALPADEMLGRLARAFHTSVDQAKNALSRIGGQDDRPLAWNLSGDQPLLGKARELIRRAKGEVLAAVWSNEAGLLAEAFAAAEANGVAPTILCLQGCERECGGCRGHIYRYSISPVPAGRWLALVVDQTDVLIATLPDGGESRALHSKSDVMVTVASHMIRNAIAVSEVARSLGPRLIGLLDADAQAALQGAGLAVDRQSWYDRVLSWTAKPHSENQ